MYVKTLFSIDPELYLPPQDLFSNGSQVVADADSLLFGPLRLLNHACRRHHMVTLEAAPLVSASIGDNVRMYSIKFRDDIKYDAKVQYPLLWCYDSKSSISCTFCCILDGTIWMKRPYYYYNRIGTNFNNVYLKFQRTFSEKFQYKKELFEILTRHFLRMLPGEAYFVDSATTKEILISKQLLDMIKEKEAMSLKDLYFSFMSVEEVYYIEEDDLIEVFVSWLILFEKIRYVYDLS